MLDSEIAKRVLSDFRVEFRLSILDSVALGRDSRRELETWGLFCACLVWGGLVAKRNILIPFYEKLPMLFTEFTMEPSQEMLKSIYKKERGSLQLLGLCQTIGDLLEENHSISNFVSESESVDHAIFSLAHTLREKLENHSTVKFNLPKVNPAPPHEVKEKRRTNALKRYCMYFRWMVRDSEPDFGIWDFFDKRNPCHPIDIHVARVLKRWGVLSDNSPNWYNVEKVTKYFREIEPEDPLKFDYHLVTFSQKFCKKNEPSCSECPVKSHFTCIL